MVDVAYCVDSEYLERVTSCYTISVHNTLPYSEVQSYHQTQVILYLWQIKTQLFPDTAEPVNGPSQEGNNQSMKYTLVKMSYAL